MIKRCTLLDHNGWLPLRSALWPDSAADSEQEIQTILSAPERGIVGASHVNWLHKLKVLRHPYVSSPGQNMQALKNLHRDKSHRNDLSQIG
jgi:hypothetical protein